MGPRITVLRSLEQRSAHHCRRGAILFPRILNQPAGSPLVALAGKCIGSQPSVR